ncbi:MULTISPECIES: MerR family transcriptional regulator [unclassified Paenibacillus]|uniref:MerR family transcriptional regulator n=1 Tax=unclassified Paenibacillus TaxID=185978 RepID=UPI000CFDAAF8|nr:MULTISPECIES: MerR family transcriptional regulator [unclassified Paenibacillus]PRA07585.1 transcriptional regulator [Paenibacillus sp. MYb63]PRA51230.1 transcriptional regulator [Paenibacillus sp. MYb67]QZN74354.1 MerR family transcriptional regulator [Paenibacillus sp. DR312]
MSDEITISELAKLMKVSVHQIRYFEEKGVLNPAYIAENQYRMYGVDEIYRLSHILLLRKMGLSVSMIKECLSNLTTDQITSLFQQALADTEAAITQLQQTKHLIGKLLHEKKHIPIEAQVTYYIDTREEIHLSLWFHMEAQEYLQARQLIQHKENIPNLFEADIHYAYDETDTVGIYIQKEGANDLVLPRGKYLSRHVYVQIEAELKEHINEFYAYAEHQGYPYHGPLIMVEKSYLSLFTPEKLHYELLLQMIE